MGQQLADGVVEDRRDQLPHSGQVPRRRRHLGPDRDDLDFGARRVRAAARVRPQRQCDRRVDAVGRLFQPDLCRRPRPPVAASAPARRSRRRDRAPAGRRSRLTRPARRSPSGTDLMGLLTGSRLRCVPPNGSFGAVETLSVPDVEAYEPNVAAGPNADANAVAVWTGSDGTNLRVQSARRKDYVGYPRPLSASPIRLPLAPAYDRCAARQRKPRPRTRSRRRRTIVQPALEDVLCPDGGHVGRKSVLGPGTVRWLGPVDRSPRRSDDESQRGGRRDDRKGHGRAQQRCDRHGLHRPPRSPCRSPDHGPAKFNPSSPKQAPPQTFPLEFAAQCVSTGRRPSGRHAARPRA